MTKGNLKIIFIATNILLFVNGCGPYDGEYLSEKKVLKIRACPSEDIELPAEHSFDAMVASLADNDWVIERSNIKKLELAARICKRDNDSSGDYLNRSVKECLIVEFRFRPNGNIQMYNPQDKRFMGVMFNRVDKWTRELERTYSELRCYSKEELSRRNAAKKDKE